MVTTRKSKANMEVSGVALETSTVEPRFLPSRAMEATLNEMWCCPITDDIKLVAEIQSQVEAKCDMRLRLRHVPSVYPGFEEDLLKYADVTQEEIDDAWLDTAIDILGRPALKRTSKNDYIQDLHSHARRHRTPSIWLNAWEAGQQSLTGRPTIRHMSRSHYRTLNSSMEDLFEPIQNDSERMSNMWSNDWEAVQQTFPGQSTRRRMPTSDYHMLFTSLEDPFESTQRDGQLMSSVWSDHQEEDQQVCAYRPAVRYASVNDYDMVCTGMEDLYESPQRDGQRMSSICSDDHGALREALSGQPTDRR